MNNILITIAFLILSNFYSLQFQDIDGNIISMNNFQGKKVLLVNIATGADSIKLAQLSGLQQLQQQYLDGLVIIAFPSNSFGKEAKNNLEIKQFCRDSLHASFIIAAKGNVIGDSAQQVFSWLTHKIQNGQMDAEVHTDFQKFLIDNHGQLVSVMSSKIKPLDSLMIQTITRHY